jgi:hypothetical protein
VTIGLFETIKTIGQALAINMSNLLDSFGLRKKIITFVKDEVVNLNATTFALRFLMSCDILGLKESFNGSCFGHVFSKGCQYGIVEEKVCKDMIFMSIKNAQFDIQKCITWSKKSGKGNQQWNKACRMLEFNPES